jgi:hypothetical protein
VALEPGLDSDVERDGGLATAPHDGRSFDEAVRGRELLRCRKDDRARWIAIGVVLAQTGCTIILPVSFGVPAAVHNAAVDRQYRREVADARADCTDERDRLYQQAMATGDREARSRLIGEMPDCREAAGSIERGPRRRIGERVVGGLLLGVCLDVVVVAAVAGNMHLD